LFFSVPLWNASSCIVVSITSIVAPASMCCHWRQQQRQQATTEILSPLASVTISLVDISVWWLQYLVSKMEFTVLKSPKGFWRSLPEISLFSLFSQLESSKDLITNPTFGIDALSFCISMAQCHPSSQAFSQFIRPSSSLS
jgi:hypothetical protein